VISDRFDFSTKLKSGTGLSFALFRC
jgi:hypothetical protein